MRGSSHIQEWHVTVIMLWVLVDFRHRSFASKDSACGRKVCGGNREWFPFSAGDFHCLIIEIYVKLSEPVQGGGISTCVPSKFEHLRHQQLRANGVDGETNYCERYRQC